MNFSWATATLASPTVIMNNSVRMRSNENKMSDGHRERTWNAGKSSKPLQM